MKLLLPSLALLSLLASFQEPPCAKSPHERWSQLDPAARERLRERFERLRSLPPEARAELHERFERLRGMEEHLYERMSPETRQRMESLSPEERREVERAMLVDRMAERGRSVRERLPEELRQRLEDADPADRGEILREYCQRGRGEHAAKALERMSRELALSPEAAERLRALPERERCHALMDLRRQHLIAEGPPKGVTPEEWSAMQSLDTREFFGRLRELTREQSGEDGGRERRKRGLWDLLRPDPAWYLDLYQLPDDERRTQIQERLRERAVAELERRELLSAAELQALSAKQGEELLEALRELAREKGWSGRSRHHRSDFDDR